GARAVALRALRWRVVLRERLGLRRPQIADVRAELDQRDRRDRKDELAKPIEDVERLARGVDAADRKEAELQPEQDDEQQAKPERRSGQEREGRSGDQMVEP